MTAPVTTAAPAARAASAASSTGGAGESAAPFASALDGALADGVRDAGAEGREQPSGETPGEETVPAEESVAAPVVDTAAVTVAAAVWALVRGEAATQTAAGAAGPAGPAVAAGSPDTAAATAPGAAGATAAQALPVPVATDPDGAAPVPGAVLPVVAGAPVPGSPPTGRPGPDLPATASARAVEVTAVVGDGAARGRATGHAGAPGLAVVAGSPAPSRPAAEHPTPAPSTHAATTATAATATPGLPVAGAPGQQPGAGDPAAGAEPTAAAVPAPDAEGLPAVTGATGPAPVAATAPVSAPVTGDGAALPVSGQVSRQVAVLSGAGTGSHTMTLVLTPETLGPVQLQVTVAEGVLDLTLRGAHELGRAALLDALPELRRDLEAAGLSPSRVEVDADAGGSWLSRHAAEQQARQDTESRGGRQHPAGEWSRPGGRPADTGEGRAALQNRSTSSGVDVRV
ncbi:flagellar hook-length control protein FliK [Blastococcus sp. SYSU DS0541]